MKEKLLNEVCHQDDTYGHSAMTIGSFPRPAGVAVGTVYNYYVSKDEILEAYFFRKWNKCVEAIYFISRYSKTYDAVIHCIFDQIKQFEADHVFLFRDEVVGHVMESAMFRFQGLMSRQLVQPFASIAQAIQRLKLLLRLC